VKCPKCDYLGFETGDRCKNCGYDFSLIAPIPILTPDPDLAIRTDDAETGAPELWLDRMDRTMDEVSRPNAKQDHLIGVPEPPPAPASDRALPLFNPDDPDDIPLIALPAAPRPPVAVRRTIDAPRLRAVPKMSANPAPALDFREEAPAEPPPEPPRPTRPAPEPPAVERSPFVAPTLQEVGGRRLVAALIDHVILFAIDLAVIYFTLRMAGLGTGDAGLLPIAPMAVFLGLLKLAYFSAFTAIGGQTIGKMAVGIRVICERGSVGSGGVGSGSVGSGNVDSARALRRTLAGILSLAPFGLGYLPAFFGADRRALHDRLAGTRVVGLPSA
jgi:uncharacterized RDD family membrane protein YckC